MKFIAELLLLSPSYGGWRDPSRVGTPAGNIYRLQRIRGGYAIDPAAFARMWAGTSHLSRVTWCTVVRGSLARPLVSRYFVPAGRTRTVYSVHEVLAARSSLYVKFECPADLPLDALTEDFITAGRNGLSDFDTVDGGLFTLQGILPCPSNSRGAEATGSPSRASKRRPRLR